MLVTVDPRDARPVFRQIADEIHRCVGVGILKPDDPLPAVRQLAAELKVNPNTVQQAYRELEREGAAYVRRGVGTFVARGVQRTEARQQIIARELASRFMREGFRHGLLASDLIAALKQIAPAPSLTSSPSETDTKPSRGR